MIDFETGSRDPDTCQAIQLSAAAMDTRTLRIFPGDDSYFDTLIRPDNPDTLEDDALAKNGHTREELAEPGVPEAREAFHQFARWAKRWHGKKASNRDAPIAAGHNLQAFDLVIWNRYAKRFGLVSADKRSKQVRQNVFNNGLYYDTLQMLKGGWFLDMKDPSSISLDSLRKYFKLPIPELPGGPKAAHNSLRDVADTAAILGYVLALYRHFSPKVVWKDGFDDEAVAAELERRRQVKLKEKERKDKQKQREAYAR